MLDIHATNLAIFQHDKPINAQRFLWRTAMFNIKNLYMVLALRCVFCTDLRTESDLCFIHH